MKKFTVGQKIKIGTSKIASPNMIGAFLRETPAMIIVTIVKRTFEPKSSLTLTHKFDKGQREWFKSCVGFERRYWKVSGVEVGGSSFIINHEKILS